MFNKKRIEKLECQVEELSNPPVCDPEDREEFQLQDYRSCYECGGLFKEDKMRRVELIISFSNGMYDDGESFFCKGCAPEYDKVFVKRVSPLPSERDEHRYYKTPGEIEVDKKGRKIKK